MNARDNLIKEYMYSGWETDEDRCNQFVEFVNHLEKNKSITESLAESVKSGVVNTLIIEDKVNWIDKKWFLEVEHVLRNIYAESTLNNLMGY